MLSNAEQAAELISGTGSPRPQARAVALRNRAILELLYAGGLRVSEVTCLSTSDLALDLGRVHVRGKGDKERIVPLASPPSMPSPRTSTRVAPTSLAFASATRPTTEPGFFSPCAACP